MVQGIEDWRLGVAERPAAKDKIHLLCKAAFEICQIHNLNIHALDCTWL